MPYLIDGHNLIGQLPGVSLDDPDDEEQLVGLLHRFLVRSRKRAIVYFDRRHPGSPNPAGSARLTVRFVSPPRTADDAIRSHLARLKREARNWIVVSSDCEVVSAAKRSGARSLVSAEFAALMTQEPEQTELDEKPSEPSSDAEIASWQRLFHPSENDPD